jgi:hypothetical protein
MAVHITRDWFNGYPFFKRRPGRARGLFCEGEIELSGPRDIYDSKLSGPSAEISKNVRSR